MKKQLLTLLLLTLTSLSFAQNKTAIKKPISKTKLPLSKEEQIKNNAEKWFKDVYVDKFFKDPYSYKLLKLTSEKISVKQSLADSVVYLDGEIAKCKLPEKDRTIKNRTDWQEEYDKIVKDMKVDEKKLIDETDNNQIIYWNKRISLHKKYAKLYLEDMKDYDIYSLCVEEKKRIQDKLTTSTTEQGNKLAFYKIKIDCYSKNSLGNEVLGRFEFPFTEKGPIGSGDGLATVIQTNKSE